MQQVHFEDYSGTQFERLVFAYHLRVARWNTLEWYGQVGGDSGRDIWGVRANDTSDGECVCIQCANRGRLAAPKATSDLDKIACGPNGLPDRFVLVCRSSVSAPLRDQIRSHAATKGIRLCEIWSGQEFEERLRATSESLLRRFVGGEVFPDDPSELASFIITPNSTTDQEILALMAELFDRPAFYTPFRDEGDLPAFKQAVTDTIEALNTGIHRLRDGTEIRRIPSRHQIADASIRDALRLIERHLSYLRARYDALLNEGEIHRCRCGNPDCPTFFASREAVAEMNGLRSRILGAFRCVYPSFTVYLGWWDNPPWLADLYCAEDDPWLARDKEKDVKA